MSFKSRSQEIIDATQVDPPENNEARIGGLFRDIGAVTETVDTIADLRALEGVANDEAVKIKGHTVNGIGGGEFVFDTTPLFSYQGASTLTPADVNDVFTNSKSITTSALTESIGASGNTGPRAMATNEIVFEGGATAKVVVDMEAVTTNTDGGFERGATTIRIRELSGNVAVGEEAFYKDDNGVYIRPASGGKGVYKRHLPNNTVSPDMFGGIPNNSPLDGAVNESSAAVQAAFDSKFAVDSKYGFYYVSSTLKVKRNKRYRFYGTVTMKGKFRRDKFTNDPHNSGIYTDLNINVIDVTAPCDAVFYIDTSQAPDHRKAGVRMDMTYQMWQPKITVYCRGNMNTISNSVETGTRALQIDVKNATKYADDAYSGGFGQMHLAEFKVVGQFVHTVVDVLGGGPDDPDKGMTINTCRFDVHGSDYYKRCIWMERNIDLSYFLGSVQDRTILPAETNEPANLIGGRGSFFDIWAWDIDGSSANSDGLWNHKYSVEFKIGSIEIGPNASLQKTFGHFKNKEVIEGGVSNTINNYEGLLPSQSRGIGDLAISHLHNSLLFLDQRARVAINSYAGTGFDFTYLGETSDLASPPTSPAPNLSLTQVTPDIVFGIGQNFIPDVSFGASADVDNDFIEIVMDTTASGASLRIRELTTVLERNDALPKRIQIIDTAKGESQNIYPETVIERAQYFYKSSNYQVSLSSESNKIIVRLIGITSASEGYSIIDFFGHATPSSYFPYIHAGGGQKIEGSLRVDELRLPSTQTPISYRVTPTITSAEILAETDKSVALVSGEGNSVFVKGIRLKMSSGDNYTDGTLRISSVGNFNPIVDIDLTTLTKEYEYIPIDSYDPAFGTNLKLVPNGTPAGGTRDITLYIDYEME